jgi:hypothetical protein
MEKKQLIEYLNENYKSNLYISNTSFSSINKSKEVWWFTISLSKFNKDFHLLLNTNQYAIWLHLPKGFVKQLATSFKIREDINAVDIEISADMNFKYLKDVKSGGSGFDFTNFVQEKINY